MKKQPVPEIERTGCLRRTHPGQGHPPCPHVAAIADAWHKAAIPSGSPSSGKGATLARTRGCWV